MRTINNWLAQRRRIARLERQAVQREARIKELAERLVEQDQVRIETDCKHVEVREHLEATVTLLAAKLNARDELLRKIAIAVGRVELIKDEVGAEVRFSRLPELVALVASDHDDLEGRIDAVAQYLRKTDPAEISVTAGEIRESVGKLIQGSEPQIVDLRDSNDTKEE